MQVRDYITQLEAHLAEVHRQSQRLIERQGKLGSSMSDFGASMVALGKFESGTLAQKFTKLGERADTLSGACQVNQILLCLLQGSGMHYCMCHVMHHSDIGTFQDWHMLLLVCRAYQYA